MESESSLFLCSVLPSKLYTVHDVRYTIRESLADVGSRFRRATIGAGQRLGDIAVGLNKKGWGLSHGTCPWVGSGGHASYGGFGLAARQWGLMLDSVTG